MTRLHEEYRSRIIPELKASLGKSNIHAVPRLQKIVVSMGVGEAVNDRKRLDQAVDQLKKRLNLQEAGWSGRSLLQRLFLSYTFL